MSRRHAAFDVVEQRLRISDLSSKNGTWVNGLRVYDVVVQGGELVRVGDSTLRIDLLDAEMQVPICERTAFGHLVGGSAAMRRLYPLCERLASSDVPVIIEGETGTGKEVLAEAIHDASPRSKGPFVVFDCTAVPSNLVESALFGHERGAFTGATATHLGVFEQADGGTLLIDEIGDLDVSLQPKLLRAIQRREIQRLGGTRLLKVDARVLAATRRNLDQEVAAGRFRDDLFYRLNVARIELPPLRARAGDVRLLAQHFWTTQAGAAGPLPEALLARFDDYDWPGNVRELHNTVMRHFALGELADFDAARQRAHRQDGAPAASGNSADFIDDVIATQLPLPEARGRVMEEFERRYVERVLDRFDGNVAKAAAASGIARRYFYVLRSKLLREDDG